MAVVVTLSHAVVCLTEAESQRNFLGKQVLPVQARPPCQCLAVGFAGKKKTGVDVGCASLTSGAILECGCISSEGLSPRGGCASGLRRSYFMLLPWLTVNGLLGGVDTIGVEVLSGEGGGEEGMVMGVRMCVHVVYNRVATSGPHNCGHGRGGQRPGTRESFVSPRSRDFEHEC